MRIRGVYTSLLRREFRDANNFSLKRETSNEDIKKDRSNMC
ncbi:hypothetical protein DI53_3880 [Sphingobacterium deserti]|uniref:Uncharacterized protein n=1 Tax=Sphingobacterium deserti TaxID=1229276 RepID=A0A0B8SYV3_9SPHI|nr:hypothetical protein DI53_3880 [Sphingobacterium deserti]